MNTDEHEPPHDLGGRAIVGLQEDRIYFDQIDIAALLRVIWRRKVWIATATFFVTMASIAYALTATEWYRAEAVLMPRDGGSSSGLVGQLSQFGGLASMAGITLGQSSKQAPLGVLRSVGFARRFVEQNALISALSEEFGQTSGAARGGTERDIQRVVDAFRKSIFTIAEDKKTGLISVVIEWKDPVVAASWANAIPRQLNEEMRQRALDEATRNVQYLQDQLSRTETVSLQQAIARLLETEMQKLMLAEGTTEYALRVIDDAQPPSKRSWPKRTMLVIVAFISGLFASLLVAILFDPFKRLFREVRSG